MTLLDLTLERPATGTPGIDRLRPILRLAAPLTGFFLIQSAVNLAVLAMMGRVGTRALAATGAAGAAYGVLLALLFGVDAAVQASVSRAVGAGTPRRLGEVLNEALALALPLGLAVAAALWVGGPVVIRAMIADPATAAMGTAYARASAPSLIFLAVTTPINACWIGSGRPARAFLVTAALAPMEVGASFLMMFGAGPVPALGATGAGLATSATCFLGLVIQVAMACRADGAPGFLRKAPGFAGLVRLARLGWPISLQQSFMQVGLMSAYLIVAPIGVRAIAVINVLVTLSMLPIQMGVGVGSAAATLVGQSLGRGDPAQARRWGWRSTRVGLWTIAPLGALALMFPAHVLGLFVHDPATAGLAVWPARLVGLTMIADPVARVLGFAIRGAGATRIGALVPFCALWIVQLPLSWAVVQFTNWGLLGIVWVQAVVVLGEMIVTAAIWRGGAWAAPRALAR